MCKPVKIDQTVRESGYAATSGTGTASIKIYNYYYQSEKSEVVAIEAETVSSHQPLRCPYRGLLHFSPDDGEFFFGRDVFVEKLFQATQARNFIPVIGGSGSGKSSVVLAGLVPKLRELGTWEFTHFRPSFDRKKGRRSIPDPFYALSKALVPLYQPQLNQTEQLAQASDLADYFREGKIVLSDVIAEVQNNNRDRRILLIADQFEELYTTNLEENIRHHFLDILVDNLDVSVTQSPPALVFVLTLRTDFLEKALAYRPFADLWQNADIKISPMHREELAQVIEKPAWRLGVKFEEGLVERILEEVENKPGNLPLLEFALSLLWEQRNNQGLTHKGYEEIGRVSGALAKYADHAYYNNLSDSDREQARHIFIQLVHPEEGAKDVRRIATKEELGNWNWSLVKRLADSRLIVTSRNDFEEDTVEVVHEVLIQNWSQFQTWMKEDRGFRIWQERLRVMVRQWKAQAEDEGGLLRGALLLEAEAWFDQRLPELSASERDLIEKSISRRDRAVQAEAIRRQKELQLTRRVAITAGMAALFAGSVLLVGGFALRQAQNYRRSLEAVFLDSQSQAILEAALPQFWQEAFKLKERDPERALGYYRQILRIANGLTEESQNSVEVPKCPERYPEDLITLSSTAEYCLSKLLETKISNDLEPQLETGEFGGTILPETPVSEGAKRFPPGALKTTYEILMTQAGAGADLNGDGRIRTPSEAQQLPCATLKDIERLWRDATQEGCGWYGNEVNGEYFEYEASECGDNSDRLLKGKTLTLLIFDAPADFAIKRLNDCGISQPEAIHSLSFSSNP